MTRFARAKGSKSSNQRLPEEATSWQEMKQGMLQSNNKRVENIEDVSKSFEKSTNPNNTETFSIASFKKKDKGPAKWSEFPVLDHPNQKRSSTSTSNEEAIVSDNKLSGKKKQKHKHKISEETTSENKQTETSNVVSNDTEKGADNSLVSKKKNKKSKMNSNNLEESHTEENVSETTNKKKNKKRKRTTDNTNESDEPNPDLPNENKKKSKRFHNNEQEVQDDSIPTSSNRNSYKNDRNFVNKNKQFNNNNKQHNRFSQPDARDNQFTKNKFQNEYKRRKPNSQVERVFINGNEVEISYYDGFPIKREDAERLKDLKKEMINRGLPKSEIAKALKLERRKAEKALTREKKKVCFNCRNSGHTLSECPSLKGGSDAQFTETGICFKCGSTEHTHFECKVTRGDHFKFAQCFICKEQGHIARQCPDNNRGLYPKGGACRVCGDVTHLKKDCPKYQSEQEEQKIVAHTIDDENIESLENDKAKVIKKSKNPQKVIKF